MRGLGETVRFEKRGPDVDLVGLLEREFEFESFWEGLDAVVGDLGAGEGLVGDGV